MCDSARREKIMTLLSSFGKKVSVFVVLQRNSYIVIEDSFCYCLNLEAKYG